jgi:putative addiction module component (TIGR02574 family)
MNTTTEQVFIGALSLPAHERAVLVQRLLLSLETEQGSPEIEAAWKTEALDRCRAADEGKLPERDAEDVLLSGYWKERLR